MEIIWKDVVGFEGLYQVSNNGMIKSVERKRKNKHGYRVVSERILKQGHCRGYCFVILRKDGKSYNAKVHRMVAEAFIANPDNLPQVNHKDENKTNNCVENLEWCSNQYNQVYGTKIERGRKLLQKKVYQYDTNGEYIREWDCAKDAADFYGGTRENIQMCCNGKANTAFGSVWSYELAS